MSVCPYVTMLSCSIRLIAYLDISLSLSLYQYLCPLLLLFFVFLCTSSCLCLCVRLFVYGMMCGVEGSTSVGGRLGDPTAGVREDPGSTRSPDIRLLGSHWPPRWHTFVLLCFVFPPLVLLVSLSLLLLLSLHCNMLH